MAEKGNVFQLMENVLFLKKGTIFKDLHTDELRILAFISREITVRDGECVVKENDLGDLLFLVKKGTLRIVAGKGRAEVELAVLPESECFGEMSLFEEGLLRSASVFARGDCTLLVMKKDDFLEAINKAPGIAVELLKLFAGRIRENNRKLLEQGRRQ